MNKNKDSINKTKDNIYKDFYNNIINWFYCIESELIELNTKYKLSDAHIKKIVIKSIIDAIFEKFLNNKDLSIISNIADALYKDIFLFLQSRKLNIILDKYNYTLIEEDTPTNTQFTAIEPDVISYVFENILASYNPDSGFESFNDRKSTGTYYTPKEIVNYMTDESLVKYFNDRGFEEKTIRKLLDYEYNESANEINEEEKNKLINIVYNLKIIDPACGCGAFLIEAVNKLNLMLKNIGTVHSFSEFDNEYRRKCFIIRHNIYGIDIEPLAIYISKLRLFLSLIKTQTTGLISNKNLTNFIKNTTNLYTAEVLTDTNSLHILNPNYKYDIVIGNPPYVDSETMKRHNPELREELRKRYTSARGNWDLFILFIEKAFQLLHKDGYLSYIVPNKLLSAAYTTALRKTCLIKKQIIEIRDYSDIRVFSRASIYPLILIAKNSKPYKEITSTKMKDINKKAYTNKISPEIFYKGIHWDKYLFNKDISRIILKIEKQSILSLYFTRVKGASTVKEAYRISKVLREAGDYSESEHNICSKFINTGTIDKYSSLWSETKTTYIKKSYQKPIINHSDLIKINPIRLEQAKVPKIIIAGMVKEIEAYYDSRGEYLAGKSTIIILPDEQLNISERELIALTGIINSKILSFWASISLDSSKMAGAYYNLSKETIKKMPIPRLELLGKSGLYDLVSQVIFSKEKDFNTDTKYYEDKINNIVYDLYNLTDAERSIIEKYFS
jgi:tRNA1(Val) A37 N6-methylase TrmN6